MSADASISCCVRRTTIRPVALTVLLSGLLQACGGGASTAELNDAPAPATPPASTNHAPTIAGSPAGAVQVGQAYTFTPQASDSDGDTLSFSISNAPAWASFDKVSGRISGTPTAAGNFANVTITVSDGRANASLTPFTVAVAAAPAPAPAPGGTYSATLSWTPPTERTDGSVLTDLAGYSIRYGTAPDSYTTTITVDNPGLATFVIDNLGAGTYYFVVSAFDRNGMESQFSNAVSKNTG